jgi:hypothetical protein
MKINPRDISYEIIWAADLTDPTRANFELLDQPEIKIQYILNDIIVNT